jgi:hypothetical protein
LAGLAPVLPTLPWPMASNYEPEHALIKAEEFKRLSEINLKEPVLYRQYPGKVQMNTHYS